MGYTIFFCKQVTPKIITIQVQDAQVIVPAVYGPATGDDGEIPGELITPEHLSEITFHGEDQLNLPAPPVYPTTFGRKIWYARAADDYSDNPNLRAELWEDTAGTATYADILAVFPELPKYVETAARNWGQDQFREITSPYAPGEQSTWPYQREDVKRWLADPAAETAFCDGLAASRGIPRLEFLQKVRENTDLFEYYSKWIYGKQQALIDMAYSATSLDGLLAITDSIGINLLSI